MRTLANPKVIVPLLLLVTSLYGSVSVPAASSSTPVPTSTELQTPQDDAIDDASGLYLEPIGTLGPDTNFPRWSSDGTQILYTACTVTCQIWLADAMGTNARFLVEGTSAIWSPTGRRIAYFKGANARFMDVGAIAIYDLATRREIVAPIIGTEGGSWWLPKWLPNERYIMFGGMWRADVEAWDNLLVDLEDLTATYLSALREYGDLIDGLRQQWREDDPNVTGTYCINCGWELLSHIEWAMPNGLWAVNRDGKYATLLLGNKDRWFRVAPSLSDVQLSPDQSTIAFSDGTGIQIVRLRRRSPPRKVYEIRLGRSHGIVPGDLFYVGSPRINPLTGRVLGPVQAHASTTVSDVDMTRNVLVALVTTDSSSILQTFIDAHVDSAGDLAAATRTTWAALRRADDTLWTKNPPDQVLQHMAGIAWSIDFAQVLMAQPDPVAYLQEDRDRYCNIGPACIFAMGRLGRSDGVPYLLARLPASFDMLIDHTNVRAVLWSLAQIGGTAALKSVVNFCATVPQVTRREDEYVWLRAAPHIRMCQYALGLLEGEGVGTPGAGTHGEGMADLPESSATPNHPAEGATILEDYGAQDQGDLEDQPQIQGYHAGIDFEGPGQVMAAADGKVALVVSIEKKKKDKDYGFGNTVVLGHDLENGEKIYTLYAHLSSLNPDLVVGRSVAVGELLGNMSASGDGRAKYWINASGRRGRCRRAAIAINPEWCVRLHFELKTRPVLENPEGGKACRKSGLFGDKDSGCYGYTPGEPETFGYLNPWHMITGQWPIVSAPDSVEPR